MLVRVNTGGILIIADDDMRYASRSIPGEIDALKEMDKNTPIRILLTSKSVDAKAGQRSGQATFELSGKLCSVTSKMFENKFEAFLAKLRKGNLVPLELYVE